MIAFVTELLTEQEVASDNFESMLGGPVANAVTVTSEVEFFDLCLLTVGEANVDATYGFFCIRARCSAARTSEASDRDAKRCTGSGVDAFGEVSSYLFTDRAFCVDGILRDVGEDCFEFGGIGHDTTDKGA